MQCKLSVNADPGIGCNVIAALTEQQGRMAESFHTSKQAIRSSLSVQNSCEA